MLKPEPEDPTFRDYISEEQIYALPVIIDSVDFIVK